jgi:hypothetical protein
MILFSPAGCTVFHDVIRLTSRADYIELHFHILFYDRYPDIINFLQPLQKCTAQFTSFASLTTVFLGKSIPMIQISQ